MVRRSVVATLCVALLGAVCGWGIAAEREKPKRKRPERKRPEPLSAEEFNAAVGELSKVAAELNADDAGAKLAELKSRTQAALKKLRYSEARAERMLQADDAKALSRAVESSVSQALNGRTSAVRRAFVQSKPELVEAEKQFGEREKQIRKEREEFYAKLRTLSPELDALLKQREELDAKRKERAKQAAEARRKAKQPRKRKKEK